MNDIIKLIQSEDYKDRFKGEYLQLRGRVIKLEKMLVKYKNKELDFTPSCSYELLNAQCRAMRAYLRALEVRAAIEKIDLA